jgi:hypothetical protein
MTKSKRTNNDLQNITQKTKDRVTRPLLKPAVNSYHNQHYLYVHRYFDYWGQMYVRLVMFVFRLL